MIKFGKVRHKPSTILKCIRLYLSYPLSYREIEEIMLGEGIKVDHSTINLWIIRHTPKILKRLQRTKKNIGLSWRMDETYVKVCKVWYFLYRAVDKEGLTIDFYFSKRRNKNSAYKFLKKAITNNGTPEKINIDKSGANTAGIKHYNQKNGTDIEIRQCKYLNNIVEQSHRKIKRKTKSLGSFKNFVAAQITLAGIEMMNMLRKRQAYTGSLFSSNVIDDFYELTRQ
jgi:putative transposase